MFYNFTDCPRKKDIAEKIIFRDSRTSLRKVGGLIKHNPYYHMYFASNNAWLTKFGRKWSLMIRIL